MALKISDHPSSLIHNSLSFDEKYQHWQAGLGFGLGLGLTDHPSSLWGVAGGYALTSQLRRGRPITAHCSFEF